MSLGEAAHALALLFGYDEEDVRAKIVAAIEGDDDLSDFGIAGSDPCTICEQVASLVEWLS